jgi:hypothetical protein
MFIFIPKFKNKKEEWKYSFKPSGNSTGKLVGLRHWNIDFSITVQG